MMVCSSMYDDPCREHGICAVHAGILHGSGAQQVLISHGARFKYYTHLSSDGKNLLGKHRETEFGFQARKS
jgi:hypothetical protein